MESNHEGHNATRASRAVGQRLLFAGAGMALLFVAGCSSLDLHYVKEGRIVDLSEPGTDISSQVRGRALLPLLEGHFIEDGESLVLLVRRFDRGKLLAVDDEIYEKLTVEIAGYRESIPIRMESSHVRLFYSRGSSGMFYKGQGVYSTEAVGEVLIVAHGKGKLKATLDITIPLKGSGPLETGRGGTVNIKADYIFEEISLDELTPWLGKRETSIGKAAYP